MQTFINIALTVFLAKQLYNWYLIFKAPTVTAEEAKKLRKKDVIFVDVRTEREYQNGHIKNAQHIPLNELTKRIDEIPKNSKIIVVCASGMRSARGTIQLLKAGFSDVVSLKGGMAAWR